MEGDHAGVYVYNQSDKAVFVNSKNTNEGQGYEPGTVIKVPPQVHLKIFDLQSFAEKITKSASESYESVFELTKMCTIRYDTAALCTIFTILLTLRNSEQKKEKRAIHKTFWFFV